jgi:predicted amidohydrolase YtcJ
LISRWKEFGTKLISPRYVKIYYDTSPDSYTALLLEDYVGRPGFKGQSNLPKEEFIEVITAFNADGIGALVHVLGDGGGRELVDVFTAVRNTNGDNGVPLHFSHAWMTRPEDIQRLSEVKDVCIDFSPALNYPAPEIIGSMVPPLGEERYQKFFNVRSAFEANMPVAFGSDWASALIPDPNGFHQMQSWITREDPEDPSSGTLNADQAITLEQAIRGFTIGGAHCLGFDWPDKIGSIEVGKLADFIVIDRNLFEIPIAELYQTQVNLTVVGGNVVYDRNTDVVDDLIDEEHFAPGTRYME